MALGKRIWETKVRKDCDHIMEIGQYAWDHQACLTIARMNDVSMISLRRSCRELLSQLWACILP
jgi:hypothetical protein